MRAGWQRMKQNGSGESENQLYYYYVGGVGLGVDDLGQIWKLGQIEMERFRLM
jgi:hypothetical protein